MRLSSAVESPWSSKATQPWAWPAAFSGDKKDGVRALEGGGLQRLAEGAGVKPCGDSVGKIQEALDVGVVGRLDADRHNFA